MSSKEKKLVEESTQAGLRAGASFRSPRDPSASKEEDRFQMIAGIVLRYGLVLVIAWIGAMKFTDYEAKGIQPLVAHSPLMSWVYQVLSVTAFSKLLGVVELATAALMALRLFSARACEVGSGMAVLMFLVTLTFLFSTPGWEPTLGGFPALSASVGQFLVKDVVLLGAALWSFSESRQASRRGL